MTTLTLRKVGGSTMLALSPALLQILGRRAGEQVVIKVESGRLIIEPKVARRRVSKYNLSDLLKEQEKIHLSFIEESQIISRGPLSPKGSLVF